MSQKQRIALIAGLGVACLAGMAFGALGIPSGAVQASIGYQYAGKGGIVELELLPDYVGVRFRDAIEVSEYEDVFSRFGLAEPRLLSGDEITGPAVILARAGQGFGEAQTCSVLNSLGASELVYSTNLVFRDRPGLEPETYSCLLDTVAAAADIYHNAKRARHSPSAIPVSVSTTLSAVAAAEGVYPPSSVLKTVSVDAEVLTDVFLASTRTVEQGDALITLLTDKGALPMRRGKTIRGGSDIVFRLDASAKLAGVTMFDILNICSGSGLVSECCPFFVPVCSIHYRPATAEEQALYAPPQSEETETNAAYWELPADIDAYMYGQENEPVPLYVSTVRAALWFESEADESLLDRIASEYANLDLNFEKQYVANEGCWVVGLKDLPDRAAVPQFLTRLQGADGVARVAPLFNSGDTTEDLLFTNRVYVSYATDASLDAFDSLNAAYGAEIIDTKDYSASQGLVSYNLRIAAQTPYDAIDAANRYYESGQAVSAQPTPYAFGVQLDEPVFPNDLQDTQWNLHNYGQIISGEEGDIGMPAAWEQTLGSEDIVIAIVDTGIDADHPDLDGKLVAGRNFYDYPTVNDQTDDTDGHGTTVAGIAAAETDNGDTTIAGIAWNCKLMPIRIKVEGQFNPIAVGEAIEWAVDNGAHVINISWHTTLYYAQVYAAIAAAVEQGVVVVASAGNSNQLNPDANPARFATVVAVGGTNLCDDRWRPINDECDAYLGTTYGSNYGAFLDLVAPAVLIPTTTRNGAYALRSGTSFAAPHAAGAAALVLSATLDSAGDTTLTAQDVQAILQFAADDQVGLPAEDTAGRDIYMGHGRLNVAAAIALAKASRVEFHVDGRKVMWFDSEGNCLVHRLEQQQNPWTDGFHIRNAAAVPIMLIRYSDYVVQIKGTLYQRVSGTLNPPPGALVITNSIGVTVAYLDQDGNLRLKGSLFQAASPDS